jgi:hypothetical protein
MALLGCPSNEGKITFDPSQSVQAPRLLVAFGEDRDCFASATEVQRYAGIAPVVERSGNRCWVTLAYRLFDVPAANLCGMGWINDTSVVLGWRLLSATAQKEVLSWGRRSCLGVQVDPDSV